LIQRAIHGKIQDYTGNIILDESYKDASYSSFLRKKKTTTKQQPARNEREEGKASDPSVVYKWEAETRDDLHSVACGRREQWLSYRLQSVIVLSSVMTQELL